MSAEVVKKNKNSNHNGVCCRNRSRLQGRRITRNKVKNMFFFGILKKSNKNICGGALRSIDFTNQSTS